ncbi:MAG: IMP dehydrogenase [Candidatus Nitrohelix vancouverensis]|uniref:Inosine-5'-monophosphate dehydrogenase n=1 Tax=Candidatus Nitrohelix vancouverensis TaxID=2705534 RepID=A0A7T0G343_9BACT|nr:MAG: IMP dehydrogenase [Candidatus Nitrohelix vancouverensis]
MIDPDKITTYLTFDDVLLLPAHSKVLPSNVDLKARLTRQITLNCPLVSAPMDTVTEASLAIALALEGGIGIIHRNLDPRDQRKMVDKVKRATSVMIPDPITMKPDQKIKEAIEIKQKYNISGIPVVEGKRVVGIVTNRDLRFETNLDKPVSSLMTTQLVTIPEGTSMAESKKLLHDKRIEKLLVVDKDGNLKGLLTIRDIENSERFPNAAKDDQGRLLVGAALGVKEDPEEHIEALMRVGLDVLVIDSAHGHSEGVLETVRRAKKAFPDLPVIGGNVATQEAVNALIKAGADAVKVGIGPGSICTTRVVTGVGVPQISAISECVKAASKKDIPIIADGGIKNSGEITKAIAAGASTVMIGSLFAGTEESPGEKILFQGRSYKEYRGMGSIAAMSKGSSERYFQDRGLSESKLVPEGVEARIPFRGSLSFTVHQLLGGLRAGMGYCGAKDIDALRNDATFIRITTSGLRESHVHDVIVTQEAPNYHVE